MVSTAAPALSPKIKQPHSLQMIEAAALGVSFAGVDKKNTFLYALVFLFSF
jgi:hypothetical protein